jgi:hypothetical protein
MIQMKSGQCWTAVSMLSIPWKKAAVQATLGPVKAKVHAMRTKTMMLVFFNLQWLLYTNYVPKGKFHCWSPEDLPEAFEEEDARDGGGGVVPPL